MINKEEVYLIKNIEEYGKLVSFCINNDIVVWRLCWDEREKGKICYHIDWKLKRCFYSSIDYYLGKNIDRKVYNVIEPIFEFDKFGKVQITKKT